MRFDINESDNNHHLFWILSLEIAASENTFEP